MSSEMNYTDDWEELTRSRAVDASSPPPAAVREVLPSPAPKKPRPKRQRKFYLESRAVPSTIGFWLGGELGEWQHVHAYDRKEDARQRAFDFEDLGAGFFVRGTAYRVRQVDLKAE